MSALAKRPAGVHSAAWTHANLTGRQAVADLGWWIVPIEFSDVPVGMEITEQSADSMEVQLRGSPWVIDTVSLGRLVARFDLRHSHPGLNMLQLPSNTLDLPPGVVVDRTNPARIQVRITSTKAAPAPGR